MNMNLLKTWRRAAKIEKFILGFLYNSFQNVVRVLRSFSDWLRRLDPSLLNSVVAYKIKKNYSWILDYCQIYHFWETHTFKVVISSKL